MKQRSLGLTVSAVTDISKFISSGVPNIIRHVVMSDWHTARIVTAMWPYKIFVISYTRTQTSP